jgi:hypothetical protein
MLPGSLRIKTKNRKMKILRLLFFLMALSLSLFTACDKEDDQPAVDTSSADLETVFDDTFEEIDAIVETSMILFNVYGRVSEPGENDMEMLVGCAEINHDPENKKIIVDFGDGCVGLLGRERTGSLIITYTNNILIPGAETMVTFENFTINGIKVEGTRTKTNISSNVFEPIKFYIKLEEGKLTWPEEQGGAIAEREVNQYRTWTRAENPMNDEFTVEGTASGKNRNGSAYTVKILTPIKYKRACWASGVFVPVEGTKQINADDKEIIIDFGDGDCDRVITVIVDGQLKQYQHAWPDE